MSLPRLPEWLHLELDRIGVRMPPPPPPPREPELPAWKPTPENPTPPF